jgi:hypothetical protein
MAALIVSPHPLLPTHLLLNLGSSRHTAIEGVGTRLRIDSDPQSEASYALVQGMHGCDELGTGSLLIHHALWATPASLVNSVEMQPHVSILTILMCHLPSGQVAPLQLWAPSADLHTPTHGASQGLHGCHRTLYSKPTVLLFLLWSCYTPHFSVVPKPFWTLLSHCYSLRRAKTFLSTLHSTIFKG